VPGTGSTFTLYLPRHYQVPQGAAPSPRAISVVHVMDEQLMAPGAEVIYPRTPALPSGPELVLPATRIDDRDHIQPEDRVLLIVEDDLSFARLLVDVGRQRGFKTVVAQHGDAVLGLANKLKPSAITLDLRLPDVDGWTVLDLLKHEQSTRHIPVSIISADEHRQRGLRMGAVGYLQKPAPHEALTSCVDHLATFADKKVRNLLLVEDNELEATSIKELIGNHDVETTAVGNGKDAMAELRRRQYHCMVLDLGLPDMSGFDLLQKIKKHPDFRELPIIVYTGKDLSRKEETQLRRLAETIIIKDVKSPERLLDETALFLHRVEANLPEPQRKMLAEMHQSAPALVGAKVLVVDDDVRNIFAITSALEQHQAHVLYAENGRDGLELLEKTPNIDVVLMDIMMPEMDGYEVMRRIRLQDKLKHLPIIALTAKAMRTDREKCIQAGASDYISKPVDMGKLLSMLRVWLSK
jgi:CheY-like chemotaxis protein